MNSGVAGFSADLLTNLHRDSRRSEARVAFARLRLRLSMGRFPKDGTSFGGFCLLFGSEKLGPARPERVNEL